MNSVQWWRWRTSKAGVAGWLLGLAAVVMAATGHADFLKALAMKESSMNPSVTNQFGYVGLFQMGTAAMTDAGYYKSNGTAANSWQGTFTGKNGVTSLAQFKANPDLQVQAITDYHAKLQSYINYFGLNQYVGQTIAGVPITASGLIAGAHLVGIGALKQYLNSGGSYVPRDGNSVPITQYITQFGGYNVSATAPTYAQVAGATPTGSVVAQPPTPPVGNPGGGPAAGPGMSAIYPTHQVGSMSPDEAFSSRTGYTMWEVGDFFKQLLGAALFLWAAMLIREGWLQYQAGRREIREIGQDNIRTLIVVSVFLVMML